MPGTGRSCWASSPTPALAVLLGRLGRLDAVLADALVDSRRTRELGLPESDRRLITAPIRLATVADVEALRRSMGTAQARIGQAPDAAKGGNSTKRIRLRLEVPGYGPVDAARLESTLAGMVDRAVPAFVLAWHPMHYLWEQDGYDRAIQATAAGRTWPDEWTVGVRTGGISPGDRAFLYRQHQDRGLVASGIFTSPAAGRDFTNDGQVHEARGLKGRPRQAAARRATRNVPIPPELVALLREHIERFGTDEDGRLFRSANGNPIQPSTWWQVWRKVRRLALTPEQLATPLMRRPYDLRHSGITWRLNSGVPATEIAAWAGHSVEMLMRVYARCVAGMEDGWIARMEATLRPPDSQPDGHRERGGSSAPAGNSDDEEGR